MLKTDKSKLIFFIVVIVLIGFMLFQFPRISIPFGVAYILALMFRPIQKMLYSVEVKKKFLAVVMLVGSLFLFSYPVVRGVNTIIEESHTVKNYFPRLENYFREKYELLQVEVKDHFDYEIEVNPVDKLVIFAQENTKSLFVYLPKIIGSLFELSLMLPLFLFFILRDERRVRFQLLKIVPNNIVEKTYYLYHSFNTKFGDYIFAKFIEATIVGVIITTGLMLLDYPFAFLLGLIAAFTNILPYVGPIFGYLPALVIGLVDQNPNTTLGAMTVLYLVANIIDLALVFPVLVSKIVNLHPIIVVVSVIVGSQLGGVVGMIISIPMAAFIKLLLQEIYFELYGRA